MAPPTLDPWLRAQAVNLRRHAGALGPFRREEFEAGAATVTEGHIQATNALIESLRRSLMAETAEVAEASASARREPTTPQLQRLLVHKERGHNWVRAVERVWDFYFELFGQRQSRFGAWLLACDRIALDCYQAAYLGLGPRPGRSRRPPPFSLHAHRASRPATFRRGIPLRRLGRQLNPFPLIQLPYHRLVNPWTLGAVLHEVSHNLQNDLGLATRGPGGDRRGGCARPGLPAAVAAIWARWNREIVRRPVRAAARRPGRGRLADGRRRPRARDDDALVQPARPAPDAVPAGASSASSCCGGWASSGGQAHTAAGLAAALSGPSAGTIPPELVRDASGGHPPRGRRHLLPALPESREQGAGGRPAVRPKDQEMIEEAARRLAAGTDPGVLPERYMIGAARIALDRRYATPGTIAKRFYEELAGR